MLPTDKALELYVLLKPHLSERREQDLVDFVSDTIDSMRETDLLDYIKSVQLLRDLELDEVLDMNSLDIFSAFMEGLVDNNIFSLIRFCESLGL